MSRAAVVHELYVAMRAATRYGRAHPSTEAAATRLAEAIEAASPPFALQLVGEAVFADRQLLPLDLDAHRRAMEVARAAHALQVHELSFSVTPSRSEAAALAGALADGARGREGALEELLLRSIGWREIPQADWGEESQEVDPEIFAVTQVSLAVADAAGLGSHGEWRWSKGLAIVRRLERALASHRVAAERTLEANDLPWTLARRSVSAARLAENALSLLRLPSSARRATVHAALMIAASGLRERGGLPLEEAAAAALDRALAAAPPRGRISPHRVRAVALLRALAADGAGDLPAAKLVALTYRVERDRRPEGASFDLTKVDLLSAAAADETVDGAWLRLVINAEGVLPPGARVVLSDGSPGLVMGPGDPMDAWRPSVLVAGRVVIPDAPVRLGGER
ncbi:MAG: hypothetical protein VYE22_16890 [Myxococcota bacterium]|nr:hypothetical protein [Myxococcota bacterium]